MNNSSKMPYRAPSCSRETALCEAFEAVLGCGKVGLDDPFFALGGKPADVLRLKEYLERSKGLTLSEEEITAAGTPARMAPVLRPVTGVIPHSAAVPAAVPLTDIQRGIWFECAGNPSSTSYNIAFMLRLPGSTDPDRFALAVEAAASRHPVLFSAVRVRPDGTPELVPGVYSFTLTRDSAPGAEAAAAVFVRPYARGCLRHHAEHAVHGRLRRAGRRQISGGLYRGLRSGGYRRSAGFIRSEKPDYMVPAVITQLERIPYTVNRKVDKRALPVPVRKAEAPVPPADDTEKRVFSLVAEVLGHEGFGVVTDLFDAGLTSIGTLKLNLALGKAFGVPVKLSDLREHPTVRSLAGFLAQPAAPAASDTQDKTQRYPLLRNQLGVLLDAGADSSSLRYNTPLLLNLSPEIDPEKLCEAVRKAIDAHPYMKAAFVADEGGNVRAERNDSDPPEVTLVRADAAPVSEDLVRTLPVRCAIDPDTSVLSFLQSLQKQLLDTMARDTVPFSELHSRFGVTPDIFMNYQGDAFNFDSLCGKQAEMLPFAFSDAKARLSAVIFLDQGIFRVEFAWRTDLYNNDLVSSFSSALVAPAEGFTRAERLREVSLLFEEEQAYFTRMNSTAAPFEEIPAQVLFERAAAEHPDRVAARDRASQISFGELIARADRPYRALALEDLTEGNAAKAALPDNGRKALPRHLAYCIYTSGSTGTPRAAQPVELCADLRPVRYAVQGQYRAVYGISFL